MKSLRAQSGSALITGMIAALSVGVVSAIILQQSQVTDKQTRLPRIKSSMLMIETQLQEAVLQLKVLKPCSPPVVGDPQCMQIDKAKILEMSQNIPGAQCSKGKTVCGVEVVDANYNSSTQIFTAKIQYQGTEVSIKPIELTINPPVREEWMNAGSSCPVSAPLLVGFESDGKARCQQLPVACSPGTYISRVDSSALTANGVDCEPFPAVVSCPPGEIITQFSWSGGQKKFTALCAAFFNPFSVLGDPTIYDYSPPVPVIVSSWPTTTLIPTTTIPLLACNLAAGAMRTWSVGANNCDGPPTGSAQTINHGATLGWTDALAPTTGAASFLCSNGVLSSTPEAGSTCAVGPVIAVLPLPTKIIANTSPDRPGSYKVAQGRLSFQPSGAAVVRKRSAADSTYVTQNYMWLSSGSASQFGLRGTTAKGNSDGNMEDKQGDLNLNNSIAPVTFDLPLTVNQVFELDSPGCFSSKSSSLKEARSTLFVEVYEIATGNAVANTTIEFTSCGSDNK